MCGRFALLTLRDFLRVFNWIRWPVTLPFARFNIAPSQQIGVVANDPVPRFDLSRWGFVPSWAASFDDHPSLYARIETVADKPYFRTAFRRRRCIIPASGFFEWRKNDDGSKTPMFIRRKDECGFAMAGVWDEWHSSDGSSMRSCALLMRPPNELIAPIHDRMAIVLRDEHVKAWLSSDEQSPDELMPLLEQAPVELFEAFAVSKLVNSPKNDTPECIKPVEDFDRGLFG